MTQPQPKGHPQQSKGDESTANADQEEWPGRGVEGVLQRDEFRVIFGHPARVCSPHLRVHAIPMMKHGHSRTCADAAVKRGHHGMSALIGVRDSRAGDIGTRAVPRSHAHRSKIAGLAFPQCATVMILYKEVDIVIYSGDSLALTLGGKEVLLE